MGKDRIMAGIDTRILVTNSDGIGRYLAIRTFTDHLTITDESTSQVMTIALTTSVEGDNTGDQTAMTVPLEATWGINAVEVHGATLELSGEIAAVAAGQVIVLTADPMLPNATVLGEVDPAVFPTLNQNTTGTAANLSGTPTLPNGTAAATQAADDSSTKIASTAFVQQEISNDTTKSPVAGPGSSQAFTVGNFGCNGKTPQAAYSVNAAATDPATTMALVNQLRAALIANGIAV
jgi:hypothetical protein